MTQTYCRILSLNAYHNTEKNGDEVFMRVNHKKIWPVDHRFEEVQQSNVKVNCMVKVQDPGDSINIDLFEFDSILSSNKIGTFTLHTDTVGGPFTTDIKLEGSYARYSIEWELVQKQVG